jgi:RHS repeat-associated protein
MYYYLADGLGSTMAIVDSDGEVQNSYTYDVYGQPTLTGSLANEYDFAGQATDASTGLQYLRARYMDPHTGRFISREPLERVPGWSGNPFAYAGGNPVRWTDPSGKRYGDDQEECALDPSGHCGVPNLDSSDGCVPGYPCGDKVWSPEACRLGSHPTTPTPGGSSPDNDCAGGEWFEPDGSTSFGSLIAEYIGKYDSYFWQCTIWGAQGAAVGAIASGGAGAVLGAAVGCAAGVISASPATDNWWSECAVWAAAGAVTGASDRLGTAIANCVVGAAAYLAPDSPASQCIAWAFVGLSRPGPENALSGCWAGAAGSLEPQ